MKMIPPSAWLLVPFALLFQWVSFVVGVIKTLCGAQQKNHIDSRVSSVSESLIMMLDLD